MMSLSSQSLMEALRRSGDEARRLEEEEARRVQQERNTEIRSFSEAINQVHDFPVSAIVNFLRRYGTITDFTPIRNLSTTLHVPWEEFEGGAVVGLVEEPNAGGFHTEGDMECDYEDLALAINEVPRVSQLTFREFGHRREHEPLIDAFRVLDVPQEDILPADDFVIPNAGWRRTIACFGNVDGVLSTLPFENLQVLHLEGNVNLQQFIVSSRLLREVAIRRNKSVEFVGMLDLPSLAKISLDRCPNLKRIKVQGASIKPLKSLHIRACQALDVASVLKVLEDASPLDEFWWSDMFHRGTGRYTVNFRPHVEFLGRVGAYAASLGIERFSPSLGHGVELEPMKTIFDAALLTVFRSSSLQAVSLRGSRVFTAIPLTITSSVTSIDASSAKALREICLYEDPSSLDKESAAKLEELIIDDCPQLETPLLGHPYFNNLKHLSCQGCDLVTNDLLQWLPPNIQHLDLTGCCGIGNFLGLSFEAPIGNLQWCSFKQTAVSAEDVTEWTACADSLEYLNLGNCTLEKMSFSSFSLRTLLFLNVDLSGVFTIDCPRLEHLWIGNRYRGWPYEKRITTRRSMKTSSFIHGESMLGAVVKSVQAPGTTLRHLQVYLPEEFGVTFGGISGLKYNVDNFWETGEYPSTFNGPVFRARWKEAEVEQACHKTKELLVSASQDLDPRRFGIVITKGPTPKILGAPYLKPRPPDAKWHKDYSMVGLGHDGGYSDQCESNWYG